MEKIDCPYIVFKTAGRMFTLNSANVLAIQEMPVIEPIPEAPYGVRGIFVFHGDVSPVIDLRTALGEQSLAKEAEAFSQMLEARKQDHIRWLHALEESVAQNTEFTLATNPHQCAFGKWYDSYTPANGTVKMHLKKVEEPHRLLHETAVRIQECLKDEGCCDINAILQEAKEHYVKTVLEVLEDAKDILKSSFREMVLVMSLDGKLCALAVDEVLSIDELSSAGGKDSINSITDTSLVSAVRKSERYPSSLILELDEAALAQCFGL